MIINDNTISIDEDRQTNKLKKNWLISFFAIIGISLINFVVSSYIFSLCYKDLNLTIDFYNFGFNCCTFFIFEILFLILTYYFAYYKRGSRFLYLVILQLLFSSLNLLFGEISYSVNNHTIVFNNFGYSFEIFRAVNLIFNGYYGWNCYLLLSLNYKRAKKLKEFANAKNL